MSNDGFQQKAEFAFQLAKLENEQVVESSERLRRHASTGLTVLGVAGTLLGGGVLSDRSYQGFALVSIVCAAALTVLTVWAFMRVFRPTSVGVSYPLDTVHRMLVDELDGKKNFRVAQYYEGVVGAVANAQNRNETALTNKANWLRLGFSGLVGVIALLILALALGDTTAT